MDTKCKVCSKEIESESETLRKKGLCLDCAIKELIVKSAEVKEETEIAGIRLKKGDMVRIVLGRNREVTGEFISWSDRLYAMTIRSNSGLVVIPYKYIKAIFLDLT